MAVTVSFAPEATDQLVALRRYVAAASAPEVAAQYVDSIIAYCEGLGVFPHRGTSRDDIRQGLRVTSFRKRVMVAFVVDDSAGTLTVIGIFAGGQDYESLLGDS
ncbi:type II toxin-antitoxin system RelE/ParE family toxin [Naumannella sp. ID2617S]|nr:type II toxin-antitoxin system RelE/ParE family toxin [Naumannella sp. ID2617S]